MYKNSFSKKKLIKTDYINRLYNVQNAVQECPHTTILVIKVTFAPNLAKKLNSSFY